VNRRGWALGASLAVVFAAAASGIAACAEQPTLQVCPALPPNLGAALGPRPDQAAIDAGPAPTVDEAAAFVADVEDHLRRLWVARDRANWVNENFITDDTEALASAAEEATAAYVRDAIVRSRRYAGLASQLPPDVARKLYLLSVAQTVPVPGDGAKAAELAGIELGMTSAYGKGQYCPPPGSPLLRTTKKPATCLRLAELSHVLAESRDLAELREAWTGWHAIAVPMKEKFTRYVALADEGAQDIGFKDVGELWRAGYDMPAADFDAEVERLWGEVQPLYAALHCFVRGRLQAKYGKTAVPDGGLIPVSLLGNMWAQEWGNVYDLVAPFPKEPSLDVTGHLKAQKWDAVKILHQGERFFEGLGFDPLPATFWERSLFARPRDREVVCHASAWDVTWSGDLRVKVCLEPTEEDFVTAHHELGHDFYFQRYEKLPILFQQGANDGFHEAIGDTIALSVTPEYLKSLGLLGATAHGDASRINQQMKMALDKVAFLPFGLMIDRWRWDVFSGKTAPAQYNSAWWSLRAKYQGVAPPTPRDDGAFDPGAKFHVASSTPYVRYFLARIYQFQFHRALCAAAGSKAPLDQCSIHDSKEAGAKLMEMLALGASKPWPDALEAIGAGRKADASALLEYFEPLKKWLDEANKGKTCGW
jgi:peptidyl-dipeptidase A